MEVAETVQQMLPGIGGKCSCGPACEQILSVADDELLEALLWLLSGHQPYWFKQAVLVQH